jgi:hypothetical protein
MARERRKLPQSSGPDREPVTSEKRETETALRGVRAPLPACRLGAVLLPVPESYRVLILLGLSERSAMTCPQSESDVLVQSGYRQK